MKNRWISLLLAMVVILVLTPEVSAQERILARPAFEGKLIELSGQRVEDTFDYLQEFYTETCPEAALMVYTADEEDRAAMQILADQITKDCETARDKAEAVNDWIARNITYNVNASAYPNDTFYRREGNCLSYAQLMQTLLRMVGVPAVVGDGWRGNMETNTVSLFEMEGHAWCFVYVDGQWVLYDPLWLEDGTTDRAYMEKWIWMNKVEFVIPASDSANLPPVAWDSTEAYYTDGELYLYCDYNPRGISAAFHFINNQCIAFLSNQCVDGGSDGWYYLDGVTDKTQMFQGQIYTSGWLSYGNYWEKEHMCLTYAFPNGMLVDGAVMEFDGNDYMMYGNSCNVILADPEDYTITDGYITFATGYEGKFFGLPWGEATMEERVVLVSSLNPDVAVVDDEGNLTCLSEGFAEFKYRLESQDGDTYYGEHIAQIIVSNEERIADYTDRPVEVPEEPDQPEVDPSEPVPEPDQPEIQPSEPAPKPDRPTEPVEPVKFSDVADDAWYAESVSWAVAGGITNGVGEGKFAPGQDCLRSQVVTFLWRAAGEPEPASKSNPFVDVKETDYFYKAVLWAVEQGITKGVDETHFGAKDKCTRAQVATFLWRYKGQPSAANRNHPFTDIKPSDYFYEAVLWAVEQEVTNGMTETTFAPGATCTRGQIVTFLYRAN